MTACSSGSSGGSSGGNGGNAGSANGKVTLTWWHNATSDPGKSTLQKIANQYHQAHPNVSFNIQPIQNEQFTTKIPLALQGSDFPDLYQQWGGGAEATQVQSGKVMDITAQTKSWIGELGNAAKGWQVNGKQYGIPFDLHIVGFWYRKDVFQKAGISSPPTTMDELNADVAKLKSAGIAPIAIGSKDRWPDAFYYEYFVLRECSQSTVQSSVQSSKFSDPCFTKAGDDLQKFLATKPFQNGFQATPAQQGAGSSAGMVANGKAAMELQGDWDPAVMDPLASSKNFRSQLGWFAFPAVTGGQGDPHAGLGGGDGYSCTVKATNACPDFLKYLVSPPVQKQLIASNYVTIPANPAAGKYVQSPVLRTVLTYLNGTKYNQLYFDQALSTSSGQALDDAVANFFAGQGSPSSIASSVSQ
jgi:raffinose/stachyose/melibiose transport system substrate-binding protein